jgi:fumarate hydratase class I
MTVIRQEDFIASVAGALQYISYYHPVDYITSLAKAFEMEESHAAKDAIAQILINSRMCAEGHRPICQDTGIVNAFVKVGMDVRFEPAAGEEPQDLQQMVDEGVRRAYLDPDNKLRASLQADPAGKRVNTKDNTPAVVSVELVKGDKVDVTATLRTRWWSGCSKPYPPWAQAGARPACSASASEERRRRRCCWPSSLSWTPSTSRT